MCNCISVFEEELVEHNTAFDKVIYFVKPDMHMESTIQLMVKKINPRGPKPVRLFLSYCPFCGERWAKDEVLDADA